MSKTIVTYQYVKDRMTSFESDFTQKGIGHLGQALLVKQLHECFY